MLTIPATIEALFKADSVRKNFRVHFPNGENADLTNSDIISGSVKFTESVCSKDALQFGLAEASRIEFECVNVQNIYGMTIECGIEVDTSSLSAADITAIQGNPGDGTLVLVGDSDIGYGFYRIPYGVFTVTSCPRSAGAMWKRRVEAYAEDNLKMSLLLSKKLSALYTADEMVQNIPLLLAQENKDISDLSLSESAVTMNNGTSSWATNITWTYNGDTYTISGIGSIDVKRYYASDSSLFRFTCDADLTVHNQIYEDAIACGIPDELLVRLQTMLQPGVAYGDINVYRTAKFDDPEDSGYIYPYAPHCLGSTVIWYPFVNTETIYFEKNSSPYKTYTMNPFVTNVSLKKYSLTNSSQSLLNLTLKSTATRVNYYSYIDALDLRSVTEGYLELSAKFGKKDRFGASTSVGLSKSSPVSMSTSEYSELWWDEYDIAPIGSVTLSYMDIDLEEEQTIIYEFGDGASTYDMTDNYLLKNLAVSVNDLTNQTVEEFVTGLLDTYFIPNIQDVAFTPVQLDALGLPYLEAGDYLEIDDGNGGTVGTYIMSRTISGEQFLEDEIESKGGEIIGNVRSA